MKLSQKGLEEYILNLESVSEIEKLLLSMVHQSYELNHIIPNIEMLMYKMFCSPISTKEQRSEDNTNLLKGNLFAAKEMQLPLSVYDSLLQTVGFTQKKKHFKKIVKYIQEHEPSDRIPQQLIDKIVSIGIV